MNGQKTTYLLQGDTMIQERRANGDVIGYAHDATGKPVGFEYYDNAAGTMTYCYYRHNLQGDITDLCDRRGNSLVHYTYDAWGKLISITGEKASTLGVINPLRYRGYYYDSETGLYYLQSRYYDPEVGRFISADDTDVLSLPYYHPGQYNQFSYCNNNPIIDRDDNGQLSWIAKIAIGAAAIAIGVGVTAITGGAAVPVLLASVKVAATSAAIGAAVGAGTSAINHRVTTGSWKGAGKAALSGAVNGAADGFMWGGITAGATFTTVAAKGIKIQKIGKLTPKNKSGKGYPGVQYKNQRGSLKSLELHSPHKSGPHQKLHWQRNTWNPRNGGITGKSQHWRFFGGRF